MFTPVDMRTNQFARVAIPSNRQLFDRFGMSLGAGHPDNTDANKFDDPLNLGMTPTESLARAAKVADSLKPSSSSKDGK